MKTTTLEQAAIDWVELCDLHADAEKRQKKGTAECTCRGDYGMPTYNNVPCWARRGPMDEDGEEHYLSSEKLCEYGLRARLAHHDRNALSIKKGSALRTLRRIARSMKASA